ncbi:hypothetical protein LOZ53_006350 [Ophidiomyces ophidiicola]|nr:hypothetical protein LOZ53_006350 [Ophidiomyces ophidiicola]
MAACSGFGIVEFDDAVEWRDPVGRDDLQIVGKLGCDLKYRPIPLFRLWRFTLVGGLLESPSKNSGEGNTYIPARNGKDCNRQLSLKGKPKILSRISVIDLETLVGCNLKESGYYYFQENNAHPHTRATRPQMKNTMMTTVDTARHVIWRTASSITLSSRIGSTTKASEIGYENFPKEIPG